MQYLGVGASRLRILLFFHGLAVKMRPKLPYSRVALLPLFEKLPVQYLL